jgi:hypothetical protein
MCHAIMLVCLYACMLVCLLMLYRYLRAQSDFVPEAQRMVIRDFREAATEDYNKQPSPHKVQPVVTRFGFFVRVAHECRAAGADTTVLFSLSCSAARMSQLTQRLNTRALVERIDVS